MARTILNYGVTGTFKTSQAAQFARWCHANYGGVVLMITTDSGFAPVLEEVQAGIVKPWKVSSCKHPIAVIKRVSKGFWTKELDVTTGIGNQEKLYEISAQEWEGISGIIVEGLEWNAKLYMTDSTRKGRSLGEPLQGADLKDTQKELGEVYLMGSRGTFRGAQEFTLDYIDRFKVLPCPWVMFTSHEDKGEDDNGRSCYGPATIGKALTHTISGAFECTLHSVKNSYTATVGTKGNERKVQKLSGRMYYIEHPDAVSKTLSWPAKLSVPMKIQAQVERRWPDGYVPLLMDEDGNPTSGIADLLDVIDPPPAAEEPATAVVDAGEGE
jgi:hypothetical protein